MRNSIILFILLGALLIAGGCGGGSSTPPPAVVTHFSVAPASSTTNAGTPFNITVTALDALNGVVSTYSGMIHFTSSDGQAVLPANSTLTNGVGTFSVTLKTVGGQSITATDTASITGTSSSINVKALGASHFSVASTTSVAAAGAAFSFTVSALNASNTVVTDYSGTVSLTSSDSQAVLVPVSATLTNGTGTFSATLKTAGAQTITATDTVTPSITGTSNSININPGAVARLAVNAPGNATTRAPVSVLVMALDTYNNLLNTYSGKVHFTSTDSKAILPPDATLPPNGTGNFSITMETVGNQTISATDSVVVSLAGTSSSISVTAASALAITSGTLPTGTVGLPYSPRSVRVCLEYEPYPSRQCLKWGTQKVFNFQLTATGGVSSYIWSWAPALNSSLPPGLNLTSVGRGGTPDAVSGTPTQSGTYNVVITVTDSGLPPVQTAATFPIVIVDPPPPVINATPAPPSGAVNLPYSFAFTASSTATPLTWRTSSGTPPPGLTLNPAGVLSGTPTTLGTSSFTLIAQDSFKQDSAPQDFTIQIFAHGFKATGSMAAPRAAATATLLNNGKVLVAGGTDANGAPLASAELYDPTARTFSATGSMAAARAHFAAALLPGGKVLVTGGLDASGNPLATAELYDPTAGTFSATKSEMTIKRASHTATLLNTGKVLVAGWDNAFTELFDPSTETFTATGSMMAARVSHTATLLNSGKVLVTGGIGGVGGAATVLAEAELYDPATGSFSRTLGNMATARQWHTASLLADGKVLVIGGMVDNAGKATATAELFDPTTQMFTSTTGSMASARGFQTATVLKDGTVLVAGGDDGTGPLATAEVYDPAAGTFSPTGSMGAARESHTATLLNDGTVLVTGGTNGSALSTAELYQ